jgi:hypothetical protein
MSFAKIRVRVLYSCGKSDDVLVFDPDMESTGFNVTYKQHSVGCVEKLWMEYDGVVPYLDVFFRSLNMDYDKSCTQVQLDVPGLPSVVLLKRDLVAYLYSVVEDHLLALRDSDVWPLEHAL